ASRSIPQSRLRLPPREETLHNRRSDGMGQRRASMKLPPRESWNARGWPRSCPILSHLPCSYALLTNKTEKSGWPQKKHSDDDGENKRVAKVGRNIAAGDIIEDADGKSAQGSTRHAGQPTEKEPRESPEQGLLCQSRVEGGIGGQKEHASRSKSAA